MLSVGVEPTELSHPQRFWADAKKKLKDGLQIPVHNLPDSEPTSVECTGDCKL